MSYFLLSDNCAYNAIFRKIREIEDKEKATEQARNMAMIAEAIKSKGKAGWRQKQGRGGRRRRIRRSWGGDRGVYFGFFFVGEVTG